jgi:hypothetical protein
MEPHFRVRRHVRVAVSIVGASNPLLGMTEQHPFEGGVVGAGVPSDGLADVLAFDERQRFPKRRTCVPSGSRQLDTGMTGVPVVSARSAGS